MYIWQWVNNVNERTECQLHPLILLSNINSITLSTLFTLFHIYLFFLLRLSKPHTCQPTLSVILFKYTTNTCRQADWLVSLNWIQQNSNPFEAKWIFQLHQKVVINLIIRFSNTVQVKTVGSWIAWLRVTICNSMRTYVNIMSNKMNFQYLLYRKYLEN